jgi:hypothetical protein
MFMFPRCPRSVIATVAAGLAVLFVAPSLQASERQAAAKPGQAQAAGDAAAVAAARGLLSEGKAQEAVARVGTVLARQPANRDAAQVKTEALLSLQRYDDALSAYDAFAAAAKKPDAAMLATIGRVSLKRLAQASSGDTILLAGALERLARDGDGEALQALKRAAASASPATEAGLAPTISLVRLGDEEAARRLGTLLQSASPDSKATMIRVLQDAGAQSQAPAVAALLADPDLGVRGAAAMAVGVLQYSKAVPQLQAIYRRDEQIVRMFAAVSLKRLGRTDAEMDTYLAGLVRKAVPELRVVVADAYQGSDAASWVPYIKELLSDRNELIRLRAAEVLACCDRPSAHAALAVALSSPLPPLRNEAARILDVKGLADAKDARRLLGDPADVIRMYGAGAALQLAAASAKK